MVSNNISYTLRIIINGPMYTEFLPMYVAVNNLLFSWNLLFENKY